MQRLLEPIKKIVIIGGVAGGATTAARARRLSENVEITILEKGPYVSFANCGLPYHIGDEITDRSKLLVHTPNSLGKLLNINVKINNEAVKVDNTRNIVIVKDKSTGEMVEYPYDKAVLCTGSVPVKLPIPGIDLPNIYQLRTIPDMDAIIAKLKTSSSAIIVGAGFIGLEVVEALILKRLKRVILIEAANRVLPLMDEEMTIPILKELQRNGVEVIISDRVTKFTQNDNGTIKATLSTGKEYESDFVMVSTGVVPDSKLAQDAGLKTANNKAIIVNQWMQTSDPNIYAVGDSVQTPSRLIPGIENTWIPLAGPANRQGRIAAEHMMYGEEADTYRGSIGTAIVRVFDLVAASTGISEWQAKRANRNYATVTVTAPNHASYYPNATPITLKVLWDKDSGKIIGAQAFGIEGVDKRIDIIATSIISGSTIDDLAHLELCYSPPFGSARDIVNIAGFAGQNIRFGLLDPTNELNKDCVLLDVRDKASVQLAPLKSELNAQNIPLSHLRSKLNDLDKSKTITTICNLGKSSYFASRVLAQAGFESNSLVGGVTLHPEILIESEYAPACPKPAASEKAAELAEVTLDACGISCPGPIMRTKETIEKLQPGQTLKVMATDAGFTRDFPAICRAMENVEFLGVSQSKGIITGTLRKKTEAQMANKKENAVVSSNNNVAIVVFSGDMDKVLAAMIIANGAVAMGGSAHLFFTFWGLNALRKESPPSASMNHETKSFVDKMMGSFMPKGMNHLQLSQMSMGGLGTWLMKKTMEKKHLPNLPDLLHDAQESKKVHFVACSMSMEALGISKEELIEECELGGVADFLQNASTCKTTLFI